MSKDTNAFDLMLELGLGDVTKAHNLTSQILNPTGKRMSGKVLELRAGILEVFDDLNKPVTVRQMYYQCEVRGWWTRLNLDTGRCSGKFLK